MRTCDAIGIQDIFVLNTNIPRHKKWGTRSSSSAYKWLTVHQFEDIHSCFTELRKRYEKIYTTHLASDAVDLYEMNLTASTALIFGNEHSGVTEECRMLADGNFKIPQVGIIQSLNISVACAVTLYEAFRQKTVAGHYRTPHLPQEYMQNLMNNWQLEGEND